MQKMILVMLVQLCGNIKTLGLGGYRLVVELCPIMREALGSTPSTGSLIGYVNGTLIKPSEFSETLDR